MDIIDELKVFYSAFKGEKGYLGFTENGIAIPYFAVEKTAYPVIICQYAIHAREYITVSLALRQIKEFIDFGNRGKVYFIPAVNIDGILIALYKNKNYKANVRGVDLNVNFDARWGTGATNVRVKGDSDFIGEFPFSESETMALKDFTLRIKPDATVSYHSKGEEIYYQFHQNKKDEIRDYNIAKKISQVTGYKIKNTPFSAGGYKDWCIDKLKIPAFTIEVGSDSLSHPIGREHLEEIFIKNRKVISVITESL